MSGDEKANDADSMSGGNTGSPDARKSEERFDIYDEQDRPIGTATRSEAHARGLWHHTFHCWLARRGEDGRARILFQRRNKDKDTNPDRFDITAAGHLSAGETVRDAVRELEEELGLRVALEDLALLGTFREEDEGFAQGVRYIDREVSEVYGYVTDREPATFRLQREELAGLYEADAEALLALMRGETETVSANGAELDADGASVPVSGVAVRLTDFVTRDTTYYIRVIEALMRLV